MQGNSGQIHVVALDDVKSVMNHEGRIVMLEAIVTESLKPMGQETLRRLTKVEESLHSVMVKLAVVVSAAAAAGTLAPQVVSVLMK